MHQTSGGRRPVRPGHGRGRKAVLRATPEMRSTIEPDLEFVRYMYAQDRGQADRDGRWHVVAFAIGESARSARDSMRDAVLRLGGALVQGGLYVSPQRMGAIRAGRGRPFRRRRSRHHPHHDRPHGRRCAGEARALAEALWPLDRIADGHHRLLATARRAAQELEGGRPAQTWLSIAIELAAEFTPSRRGAGPAAATPTVAAAVDRWRGPGSGRGLLVGPAARQPGRALETLPLVRRCHREVAGIVHE